MATTVIAITIRLRVNCICHRGFHCMHIEPYMEKPVVWTMTNL